MPPVSAGPRVLVTGATGFLGWHLTREMSRRGWAYAVLARSAAKAQPFLEQGIEVARGDITDVAACERSLRGRDVVLHLAAAADVSDPELNRRVNVDGLRNLIGACRSNGVRRLLFVSSTCAGRRYRDAYGETKLQGEQLVRDSGLRFTILRPTMIYGRGSKEFDTFVRAIRLSPIVPLVESGRAQIQPVYLGDAVSALLEALHSPKADGRTYDLAGATSVSIAGLVRLVCQALGLRRRLILPVPVAPAVAAARALGRLMRHVPITVDQVLAFTQDTVVDLEPIRADLGFSPRSLADGLPLALAGAPPC
jgi:nucleoside-diphosphate-sugar epimerase